MTEKGSGKMELERVQKAREEVEAQLSKVIVGQKDVIDQLMICILSRGHCLLEGVPGLAKTLMISTLARTMSLSFSRIQFTPDLMPADITGTEIIEENKTTGGRERRFLEGPLFANVVLADEINRTPPKTQAALLEAMQERQVTVGRQKHLLGDPFFVLATQNPIEQEGTYPLPEANRTASCSRFPFITPASMTSLKWRDEPRVIRKPMLPRWFQVRSSFICKSCSGHRRVRQRHSICLGHRPTDTHHAGWSS